VSKVKLQERSSKVVFLNVEKVEFVKIQVDGCIVNDEIAADWVVAKSSVGDIFLELKGRNVEHAVQQVAATLRHWKNQNWFCGEKIAALIVSRQVPKASLVRKQLENFVKEFKCPLHVVSHNQEITFENVLSFKGPYKA
jgi:hypothetical protein